MVRDRARVIFSRERWGAVVSVVFFSVMVAWPLAAVMQRSFVGVGPADGLAVLTRSSVRTVLWFTLWQALLSAALTLLLGLPIAHALARYDFLGRSLLRSVAVAPFVLPTVVVATAFSALFRRSGVDIDDSVVAILAAHVFFNLAVVIRVVGGFWERLDRSQVEAARVLGASPVTAFRQITLRQLLPVVTSAALLVFLFSFTSYGVILILGGVDQATIETEIRRYAIFRQEFDVAAVLAIVQILTVSLVAATATMIQRRHGAAVHLRRPARRLSIVGWRRRLHLALVLIAVIVVVGAPLLALVEQSLTVGNVGRGPRGASSGATSYGFDHYRALTERASVLPVSPVRALSNSLLFAALAAVVASTVALFAARAVVAGGRIGRMLEFVTLLPLGISAVTLGFGYLLAFSLWDLRRSIWLIPVAHAVIGLPFVLASLTPALRSVDERFRQAAATLGASPSVVRRAVEWPLIRPALLSGAGFAMAVSLGEFGATSFLSRADTAFTAPLAVFNLLSRPGATLRGQALALSVVIGALVALLAALLERRRGSDVTLL